MLFLRHYVGDGLLKQQRETTRASRFTSPRPRLLGVVPRTGHRLSRAPELTSLRPLVQTWFGQPRVHASSQPAVTPPRLRGRRRLPRTQGMPARAQAPGVRAVLPPGTGPATWPVLRRLSLSEGRDRCLRPVMQARSIRERPCPGSRHPSWSPPPAFRGWPLLSGTSLITASKVRWTDFYHL